MIQCFNQAFISTTLSIFLEKVYFVLLKYQMSLSWTASPHAAEVRSNWSNTKFKVQVTCWWISEIYSEFLKSSSIRGQPNKSKQVQCVLNEQLSKSKFNYFGYFSLSSSFSAAQFWNWAGFERELEHSSYSHNIISVVVAISELFIWMLSHQKWNEMWPVWQWTGQQVFAKSCF